MGFLTSQSFLPRRLRVRWSQAFRFCVRPYCRFALALHPLPIADRALIIAFGLIVQGYSVWKLRHALDWSKLWPFVIGAAIGVPIGVDDSDLGRSCSRSFGVGIFLVLYSLYALFARP